MKFCIVHYNTPELTTCLCSSINKFHNDAEIIIFENSDTRKFNNYFDNVTVIDNSNSQLLDFNTIVKEHITHLTNSEKNIARTCMFGSLKHTASVQWLLNNIVEPFVLLDSDVLIKRNLKEICDTRFAVCAGIDRVRIAPYVMYMQPQVLAETNIHFYEPSRFNQFKLDTDTGGTFLTDIRQQNIAFKQIQWQDYVLHFGNGSWRNGKTTANLPDSAQCSMQKFLLDNKVLWQ